MLAKKLTPEKEPIKTKKILETLKEKFYKNRNKSTKKVVLQDETDYSLFI
jgi:hypothetical protein